MGQHVSVLGLELVVLLAAAVLLCNVLAHRLHVAQPVLQLAVGVLLGFLPALRAFHLPPDVVLLLFLPALLYWESLNISLRALRASARVIVLLSIFLVIFTAGCVAWVAHALGLAWGPAWVLGAAVAPTDATAVSALARALPRRNFTILRAESLVNDGTALVVYGIAVGVTFGSERLTGWNLTSAFLLSYVGGVAIGLAVGWLSIQLQRRLSTAFQYNVTNILTPFGAYLAAEAVHSSGVLAVVTAGLLVSHVAPRLSRPASRRQAIPFWSLATTLLNGSLFVLVGIETQAAVRNLTSVALTRALLAVVLVSVTVVGARFFWLFTTTYVIRALDRRPEQRARRASARARVVSGSAGFRGSVSLAAALAVPQLRADGSPFPNRDLIIFVVAGVITLTLVVQALALPRIVAWAHLSEDSASHEEARVAETEAIQSALDALPDLAAQLQVDDDVADRVRHLYEHKLALFEAEGGADGADGTNGSEPPEIERFHRKEQLELALLGRKRDTVIRLRDEGRIDDGVLRSIMGQLDLEEARLSHARPSE